MDKLRPFQVILLAVFGFAAVLGLILFANYSGFGGSTQDIGAVSIWGTLPETAVVAEIEKLAGTNDAFAGVKYTEISDDAFNATLSEAIASGAGPDLVIISQEQLLALQSKLQLVSFATIPQRTYVDTYLPLYELFLTSTGTYGIPYLLDPLVMYYNRSLLTSLGIANPPQSWEGIAGLTPTISVRDNAGTVSRSAVALGDYANIAHARAIISLLLLQSGTTISEVTQNGVRSTLVTDMTAIQTPVESAIRFYTQFADPSKTVYSWNRSLPNSRDAFLAGDLAFYLGYASEVQSIKEANPNLSFDMASVPQPANATAFMTYGKGYVFALPKQALNPTGAISVASIMGEQGNMTDMAQVLNMAPARKNALQARAEDLYAPVFYSSALVARGWLSPSPSTVDGIFAGMISNITSGRQDITEALNATNQSLNATLR